MRRALFLSLALWLGLCSHGRAQQVDCQAIMSQLMCGMNCGLSDPGRAEQLAYLYNTYCQGGGQPQRPQEQVGDYCRNGGTCLVGYQCTSNSQCMQRGDTECGDHTCRPGYYCGSHSQCMANGSNDCGNGSSCSSGSKCSRDGKHCLTQDAVDCGTHSCGAGAKCGTGNQCLARDEVDCGKGRSCSAGNVCMPDGSCISRERLAQRVEDEKRKKAEEERRAKEAKEAEELAKKEKLRLAQEEAHKKVEAEREAARQKEEQRRMAEAQKRAEAEAKQRAELEAKQQAEAARRTAAEAEAKRKADEFAAARLQKQQQEADKARKQADAKFDKELEAIARDPRQSQASRAIAAIALGKDPSSLGIPNLRSNTEVTPKPPTQAEREIAMIALGKGDKASQGGNQASAFPQGKLRAVLEDPQQSAASREIAAIALGKDISSPKPTIQPSPSAQSPMAGQSTASTNLNPAASATKTSDPAVSGIKAATGASNHSYTFKKTNYGTIQISDHGKIVATTTPELATNQYGYNAPKAASSATPIGNLRAVPTAPSVSASPGAISSPKQSANLWNALEKSAGATGTKSLGLNPPVVAIDASKSSPIAAAGSAANKVLDAGALLSKFYDKNPVASGVIDTLATAGGAIDKMPGAAKSLPLAIPAVGYIGEGALLTSMVVKKNYGEIPPEMTKFLGSSAAGYAAASYGALASPLAAGVFVGSYDFSQAFIAPKVSPWLGSKLYDLNPSFWTNPPSLQLPNDKWAPLPSTPTNASVFPPWKP